MLEKLSKNLLVFLLVLKKLLHLPYSVFLSLYFLCVFIEFVLQIEHLTLQLFILFFQYLDVKVGSLFLVPILILNLFYLFFKLHVLLKELFYLLLLLLGLLNFFGLLDALKPNMIFEVG